MPSLQEQTIKITRRGVDNLFRSARFVPADKQADWVPMGAARPTLEQLVEVAVSPLFYLPLVIGEAAPPWDEEVEKAAMEPLTTVEAAEEAAHKNFELLYSAIASLSDSDLDVEVSSPWGSGTRADWMMMPYWNTVYHIGQINYIQLLLGDAEMH